MSSQKCKAFISTQFFIPFVLAGETQARYNAQPAMQQPVQFIAVLGNLRFSFRCWQSWCKIKATWLITACTLWKDKIKEKWGKKNPQTFMFGCHLGAKQRDYTVTCPFFCPRLMKTFLRMTKRKGHCGDRSGLVAMRSGHASFGPQIPNVRCRF